MSRSCETSRFLSISPRRLAGVFMIAAAAIALLASLPSSLRAQVQNSRSPAAATAAVVASAIPRNQTVILGKTGAPITPNANPLLPTTTLDSGRLQAVFEQLFYLPFDSGKLHGWLATGYKFSKHNRVVVITLRKGVTWSDGVPFTSQDVVYTLNTLKNTQPPLAGAATIQSSVSSVRSRGKYAVVINLKNPDPRFVQTEFAECVAQCNVVEIVPYHIFKGKNAATFTFFDLKKGWPVGTGPYRLVSSNSTREVYMRNDHWWAAKIGFHKLPAPRSAIWVFQGPEDSQIAQISSNALDVDASISRGGLQAAIAKNPKLITWSGRGWLDPATEMLLFNTTVAPWNDPKMRHALDLMINKRKFSTLFNGGRAALASFPFSGYGALNRYIKANGDILSKYRVTAYDPAGAAAILTAKGYTKKGGKWVDASGKPLTVSLKIFSGAATDVWGVGLQLLSQDFNDAGVTLKATPLDFGPLLTANLNGDFGVMTWFELGSPADPWAALNTFTNTNLAPIGTAAQFQGNTGRWNNSPYTAVVNKIRTLQAGDARIGPLVRKAMTIWAQQLPAIPLSYFIQNILMNRTYWTNWPTAKNPYIQPANWWSSWHQVLINLKPVSK